MTIKSLQLFNEGFKNKNLEKFYNKSSKMVQNMTTLKEFNETYIGNLDRNIIFENIDIKDIRILSKNSISKKTI
jgi:hypothetical protein